MVCSRDGLRNTNKVDQHSTLLIIYYRLSLVYPGNFRWILDIRPSPVTQNMANPLDCRYNLVQGLFQHGQG